MHPPFLVASEQKAFIWKGLMETLPFLAGHLGKCGRYWRTTRKAGGVFSVPPPGKEFRLVTDWWGRRDVRYPVNLELRIDHRALDGICRNASLDNIRHKLACVRIPRLSKRFVRCECSSDINRYVVYRP